MYPKPVDFRYTKDLFKFIGVLSVVACIGLAYSLSVMYKNGQEVMIMIVRSLDITTIVVAPALPGRANLYQ